MATGLNTTVIVHDAPGATDVPTHWSSVRLKSRAFVPAIETPLMNSDPVPALLSVRTCDALVAPTVCGPNVKLDGLRDAAGWSRLRAEVVTLCPQRRLGAIGDTDLSEDAREVFLRRRARR